LKILVSNDDGIFAKGIRVLAERLAADPANQVYVCAPDGERSCTGHSLTLHQPLWVKPEEMHQSIVSAWSTSGNPADCVKLAIKELLPEPPDIIVAGINSEPNLGSVLFYSGTVAAAAEGVMASIPSIAVSLVPRADVKNYHWAADFIADLIKVLPQVNLSPSTLLNVNIPDLPLNELNGIAITEVGNRLFEESFEKRRDPRGRTYYWLLGEPIEEDEPANTDVGAVARNQISITPLAFNLTDHVSLPKLGDLGELVKSFNSTNEPTATKRS
jgi:5'-nucleotidase